jgi:hypothetical protein
MRICPTNHLKNGMVTAKNIYDVNYRLLVKENTKIDKSLINLIRHKNIPYLCVLDSFSDEVELHDLISDKIRLRFLDYFQKNIEKFNRSFPPRLRSISERLVHAIDQGNIRFFDFKVYRQFAEDLLDDIESLEAKDRYFVYLNSDRNFLSFQLNCAVLSLLIGLKLNFSRSELILLAMASFFHDIGHVFKPNFDLSGDIGYWNYDDSEEHFKNGYLFLRESKFLTSPEYLPALEHGEYCNGSGKPNGKISDNSMPERQRVEIDNQIYHFSEIIACVSNFLELCYEKDPYHSYQQVFRERRSKYNFYVANTLGDVIRPYPPGFMVELALNNQNKKVHGLIISTHPETHLPLIKTEDGDDVDYIDAHQNKNIQIRLII